MEDIGSSLLMLFSSSVI